MKTKQIIRIEHPEDGLGIWTSSGGNPKIHRIWFDFTFADEFEIKHKMFPLPMHDGLDITEKHFCAFKSIDQLKEWINKEWFKEIFEKGFEIYLISVNNFQEGKYQIIYTKESIISQEDITNIFK